MPTLIEDGNLSSDWRVVFVETLDEEGRTLKQSHLWPFGITLRPNQDPAEIRQQVAKALSWPEAILLDGSRVESFVTSTNEVRLSTIP